MDIKKRLDEINELRTKLDKEVEDLKKMCKCETYIIGLFSWRAGSFYLSRICDCCSSVLGDPSKEETDDYNNEMEQRAKVENHNIGQGTKIYKSEVKNK